MRRVECGVSRRDMRELQYCFRSDNWEPVLVRVREGRDTGVLILAAWMLGRVSPRLSGNYYLFGGVGNFPRRRGRTRPKIETRKGLRARINRAIEADVMAFREPEYKDKVDASAGDPPNAAPNPRARWDIPLVAWQSDNPSKKGHFDLVLIPTHWRSKEYRSQIHPTDTFRLEADVSQIAALIELGELILDRHQSLKDIVQPETAACWENLKRFLRKQHRDTKQYYDGPTRSEIEKFDKAMQGSLNRTAMALYLASSLIRLWPPSWVIEFTEAIRTLKETPPRVTSCSFETVSKREFRNHPT